jgi:hypothetical protein
MQEILIHGHISVSTDKRPYLGKNIRFITQYWKVL